ncbi:hypothetical protein [Streptomyces thermolilacinus]|uniref:hypothetical protein n=1 Tax=Streptomyces thermolilacinus TaxID=285540 RepID=UPI001112EDB8|nr:hypothetical protein [Streptomyces thermolilacinus]
MPQVGAGGSPGVAVDGFGGPARRGGADFFRPPASMKLFMPLLTQQYIYLLLARHRRSGKARPGAR